MVLIANLQMQECCALDIRHSGAFGFGQPINSDPCGIKGRRPSRSRKCFLIIRKRFLKAHDSKQRRMNEKYMERHRDLIFKTYLLRRSASYWAHTGTPTFWHLFAAGCSCRRQFFRLFNQCCQFCPVTAGIVFCNFPGTCQCMPVGSVTFEF